MVESVSEQLPLTSFRYYSPEEQRRRWEHLLHEETTFNTRLTLFFLAETLLFATFGDLLGRIGRFQSVSFVLSGLAFSCLWCSVNYRQLRHLECSMESAKAAIPDYRETCASSKRHPLLSRLTLRLLAFSLPSMTFALWLILFTSVL